MSFFSDLFGGGSGQPTDDSDQTESKSTTDSGSESSANAGASSGFWSNLLGSGGAGSSLISSAGGIGLGLVKNDAAKIQGDYQVQLAKLTNDASLSKDQFNLALNKLNADREAALAEYKDQARNDGLVALGIVGGFIALIVLTIVLVRNRRPKPTA